MNRTRPRRARHVLSRPAGLLAAATVALAGVLVPAATASVASPDATPTEWTATWIGRDTPLVHPEHGQQDPAPLLRREFDLGAQVVRARLDIVGLGYYVAWINGKRVGDQVLDPPPSQYDKTAFSRAFDVTQLVREGRNANGVELGRSYFASPQPPGMVDLGELLFGLSKAQWWEEPRLLAQLDVTLADGSTRRVVTDGEWKIGDGPTRDALYYGELYDARQAKPGWTEPSYDDGSWAQAPEQPAPTEKVVPAGMPPVKVVDTLRPAKVTEPEPGGAVANAGIGANQILRDAVVLPFGGDSALRRFTRDVVSHPGVTDVILHEGTNDIGLSGAFAEEIIAGMKQLAAQAHAAGLRIHATTQTPAGGATSFPGHSSGEAVATREAVNGWIRTHWREHFDGFIDFGALLADPEDYTPAGCRLRQRRRAAPQRRRLRPHGRRHRPRHSHRQPLPDRASGSVRRRRAHGLARARIRSGGSRRHGANTPFVEDPVR